MKFPTSRWRLFAVSLAGVLALGACSAKTPPPASAASSVRPDVAGAVENNVMESALYTGAYEADEHAGYRLPAHVRWRVLPRYLGIGGDGREIVDERITVVLEDGPNRFWPVIVKMSTADAEKLQRELARIIAEKKSGDGKVGRDETGG